MKLHKPRVRFAAMLLVGTSILVAAPSYAVYSGAGMTEKSTSVTLADLNLSSDAGVAVLYKRLQRAAESVCGPQDLRSAGSITALRLNKACYSDALDRAVANFGHEALEALHGA